MDFETQQPGLTKWQAIRNAIQAFATDPLSQGIGVALSFFPIIDFTEPELCSAVGPLCGTPSNCVDISVCSTGFNLCDTDQDCIDAGFPQDTCVPYGICQNAPQFGCLPTDPSFNCQSGTGPCIQGGLCWDHFTCDAGPYQSPIFGVAELPAGAATFINTIDGKTPVPQHPGVDEDGMAYRVERHQAERYRDAHRHRRQHGAGGVDQRIGGRVCRHVVLARRTRNDACSSRR